MIACLSVNVMFSEIFIFGALICDRIFFPVMAWFGFGFFVNMSLSLQVQGLNVYLRKKKKAIKCFLHFLVLAILVFLRGCPCS